MSSFLVATWRLQWRCYSMELVFISLSYESDSCTNGILLSFNLYDTDFKWFEKGESSIEKKWNFPSLFLVFLVDAIYWFSRRLRYISIWILGIQSLSHQQKSSSTSVVLWSINDAVGDRWRVKRSKNETSCVPYETLEKWARVVRA